ncbi:MAG: AAA family ATPase [Alphaproteobacteria bacterium]|nr:AAA family ATPase [Alphaproteobacteria bacterium]
MEAHAAEVAEIRERVEGLPAPPEPMPSEGAGQGAGTEGVSEDAVLTASAPRLDLELSHVLQHLGELRIPESIAGQCAAALSAGKHLLLVGPPGTGKTDLAYKLAAAATTEAYIEGLFTATASADWTTFETIGATPCRRTAR